MISVVTCLWIPLPPATVVLIVTLTFSLTVTVHVIVQALIVVMLVSAIWNVAVITSQAAKMVIVAVTLTLAAAMEEFVVRNLSAAVAVPVHERHA